MAYFKFERPIRKLYELASQFTAMIWAPISGAILRLIPIRVGMVVTLITSQSLWTSSIPRDIIRRAWPGNRIEAGVSSPKVHIGPCVSGVPPFRGGRSLKLGFKNPRWAFSLTEDLSPQRHLSPQPPDDAVSLLTMPRPIWGVMPSGPWRCRAPSGAWCRVQSGREGSYEHFFILFKSIFFP